MSFVPKVFQTFFILVIFYSYSSIALPNTEFLEHCPIAGYNASKKCLLRDEEKSQDLWNYWSGYWCYQYTNEVRFTKKYNSIDNYTFTCREQEYKLPVAFVDNVTIAVFNYKESDSLRLLQKSFKSSETFENYVKCCKEAGDCCENQMTYENILYTEDSCPVIWDAWSCFPRTPVGTTATLPCSSQVYQSPDKVCKLNSRKTCYWNDTLKKADWNQHTDYSTCGVAPVYLKRHRYHVIVLYVCIACSLPAIIVFLSIPIFRDITRVIMHRNLLIAIVIRNVLTILSKNIIVIDALLSTKISNRVMEKNPVSCRILTFFVNAATNATYACMLVDGYYLHKVIVRAFAKEPHPIILYIAVAVLTFLPSLIWATVVAINNRVDCWTVASNGEQWAVDSFRVVILTINTILLLDIIRVMLSKMKQGGTTRQTKAAFRATLFLIPLFGLHIFITAKKFAINDTCLAEDIYDYFRYTMEASQGIFVALLFCYANAEVHSELRNAFRKLTIHLHQTFGWNIGIKTESRRRTTTATYVQARDSRNEF